MIFNLRVLVQHVKDTIRCSYYGVTRPAWWETKSWLRQVDGR